MENRKHTSQRIAALAAKTLGNPRASKKSRALAGSALAQTPNASPSKHNARATAT